MLLSRSPTGKRGYRRFRSGTLNVTPIGDEELLVDTNSRFPLLSLPPEVRNCIWAHALGNSMIQAYHRRWTRSYRLRLKPPNRANAMSLLRTCRQIYQETAILPFKLNTFTMSSAYNIQALETRLKPYQRAQITSLQFEVQVENLSVRVNDPLVNARTYAYLKLLTLEKFEICVFGHTKKHADSVARARASLMSAIQSHLPHVYVAVTTTELGWHTYNGKWYPGP